MQRNYGSAPKDYSRLSEAEKTFFAFLTRFVSDFDSSAIDASQKLKDEGSQFLRYCEYHGICPRLHSPFTYQANPMAQTDPIDPVTRMYLVQLVRNTNALHQLKEIAIAFSEAGIPMIALKGTAAILWLYDDIACRQISDLDILVEHKHVRRAAEIMYSLGYWNDERSTRRSLEEELIAYKHLRPFIRQGSFNVEIHTSVFQSNGRVSIPTAELFAKSVPIGPEMPYLRRLSTTHFILSTVVHYSRHLLADIPPLKFILDGALAVKKASAEIDWNEFWRIADEWGVYRAAAIIMATIEHFWKLGIHGVPEDAVPLPPEALILGAIPISARELVTTVNSAFEIWPGHPTAIWTRLSWARELPDTLSRIRYVLRIFFPVSAYIRHQYNVPQHCSVVPYYPLYFFELVQRFAAGFLSAVRRFASRKGTA